MKDKQFHELASPLGQSRKTMYRYLIGIILIILWYCSLVHAESKHRTVVDQLGRNVTLTGNLQRIVALAPSITEIIFALEQSHRLKGVTQFSDFPPEAKQIPSVGSYVNLDLEKIVFLKPDLCIATKDGNSRQVVEYLESLHIPVYAVDPKNLNSVMDTILEVGKLLEVAVKADLLVADMRVRIDRIKTLIARADDRPRVFFQIGISPIVSVGTHTFTHELIVLAGGINLAQGPVPYPRYSREQVLGLSPEVFIISSMARGEVFERVKIQWSRWSDLPAVKNNRICLVDSNILDRPTPRMVDGLELLARIIHPELFETEKSENQP